MKIGRNNPCPCGSGKKYKKCCLKLEEQRVAEERQANREKQETAAETSTFTDHDDFESDFDNEDEDEDEDDDIKEKSESDKIWDEFKDGDCDQKVKVLEGILDDPGLFEEFDPFELFHELHNSAKNQNNREVFRNLTIRLKAEYPDPYEDIIGFLLSSLIQDALIEKNKTEAGDLFLEFAENADADIDSFNRTLDQMAYYGDLNLLLSAMHKGWSKVEKSSDIVPWGIDEYADLAAEYEILKLISEVPDPDPTDSGFLTKLEQFIEPDIERLKTYLSHLTGTAEKEWSLSDFNYKVNQVNKNKLRKRKGKRNNSEQNLLSLEAFSKNTYHLTSEFLGYLIREERMTPTRAEMARSELSQYLVRRAQGELVEEPSMFEKMMNPKLKNKKQPPLSFENILCPDRGILDLFIAKMFSLLSFRLYRAIITFECIPAWLRFLESKGLIEGELCLKTMSSVYPLYDNIKNIVAREGDDSQYLLENLEKAYIDS